MKFWRRFSDGYEAGIADAKAFLEAERRIYDRVVERLEHELARTHDDLTDAHRRLTEAVERADLAADRLMEVYGRSGISAAYERAKGRDLDAKVALAKAATYDPLAPVKVGDPDCMYATEEEASEGYA
jgi:hypothetical protein